MWGFREKEKVEDTDELLKKYLALIDKCLVHFVGPAFTEELARAKSVFFERAGVLDETTPGYDLRMSQFFDWYFFTHELSGYGLTALHSVGMIRGLRLDEEELQLVEQLKSHRHGLFEFVKKRKDDLTVTDIFTGKKLVVRNCNFASSFSEDEYFEARLFPAGDTWVFGRGFCFHPFEAKKFIVGEIKKHLRDPDYGADELMLRLLKMRYRAERFRHVALEHIYTNNSKFD